MLAAAKRSRDDAARLPKRAMSKRRRGDTRTTTQRDEDLVDQWRPGAGLASDDRPLAPEKRARLAQTSLLFHTLRNDVFTRLRAQQARALGGDCSDDPAFVEGLLRLVAQMSTH